MCYMIVGYEMMGHSNWDDVQDKNLYCMVEGA